MSEQGTTKEKLCTKLVEGPRGRWFRCNEPAKFLVAGTNWYRCRKHGKQHRDRGQKVEPV